MKVKKIKYIVLIIAVISCITAYYMLIIKPKQDKRLYNSQLEKAREAVRQQLLQKLAEGWNPDHGGPGNPANRYPNMPYDLDNKLIRDIIFDFWQTKNGKIDEQTTIPPYIWAELNYQLTGTA